MMNVSHPSEVFMQSNIFRCSFSLLSACCIALAIGGTPLVQAAEFKPFLTLQTAGPATLINVVESFADLFDPTDTSGMKAQLAPYKNLQGVNAASTIGLAVQVNEETPFGLDAVIVLPISNLTAFNIPGMEMQLMMIKSMLGAPVGGKFTVASPVGNLVAYQKTGFFILATEGAADFAATADPKTLFAGLEEFTFGGKINLENVTMDNVEMVLEKLALPLAMMGIEYDPQEVIGTFAQGFSAAGTGAGQQLADMASMTAGITIDPRTLDISSSFLTVARKNTELAEKFAKVKEAYTNTKLGAFLLDTPQTVLSWHYLEYFTDTEIEALKEVWEIIAEGFLEGLYDAIEGEENGKLVSAVDLAIEYMENFMDFLARERLLDFSYWMDSEGTFISAMGTDKTAELTKFDEDFYAHLLEILGGDGAKTFIESKMRRDYETVAGYSLSCVPNLFEDLPADIDMPDGVREILTKIPLSLIWGSKDGEALVYATGFDFAKMEAALKAALARTQTPTLPKHTSMLALRPLGELLQNQLVPAMRTFGVSESDIAQAEKMFAKLAAVNANAKMVITTEYPDDALHQKVQINGAFVTALYGTLLQPAVQAAQGAAHRMQCSNHMKILVLALHNYHDTMQGLPPLYTVDAEGKPLHSWRVLILPYIEQVALYQSIRLDEPWDSPHNQQFHNVIVPYYSCPDNPLVAPGKACTYVAVASALRPALPSEGQRPRDTLAYWQDGTSNQIVFVEVKTPFNWMDPTADVTLDELAKGINAPDGKVGSFHTGGINVGLGDGAVRFVTDDVDSAILRALGDPRDGRVVSLP